MSLDCIRAAADCARLSDCVQELRTVQLTIQVWAWDGDRLGEGDRDLVSELVMPKYQVKSLSSREVASSGGHFKAGDVRVLGIVPTYNKGTTPPTTGGYSKDQLDPAGKFHEFAAEPVRNREVEYVLSGDTDGIHVLIDLNTDRIASWSMVLRRTEKSP
jgi:hypothetical protein